MATPGSSCATRCDGLVANRIRARRAQHTGDDIVGLVAENEIRFVTVEDAFFIAGDTFRQIR
jgi:hypothetical protein